MNRHTIPPKGINTYEFIYFVMIQDINEWLEKLKKFKGVIIVEGPKDKKALQNIAGMKKIFVLSKKPLYSVVEKIASETDKVVILTDLDRKGKELFARLRNHLQKHGITIDDSFRDFLFKKTHVSHIEGLETYISKVRLEK
ncbi:toprim domain-containing protein [Candidatus Woesearchaeota archaeon]|nr:toprim domain-containing protein [Candidatus Woesearchaeota archaeon]